MKTAICTIVANEFNLDSFIAYHLAIGFDAIFIFEDTTNQVPVDTGRFTEKQGVIFNKLDYSNYSPVGNKQVLLYSEFCKNMHVLFDWVAFIDADEYIGINAKSIKHVLADYANYSALQLNWKMYGPKANEKYNNPVYRYNHRLPITDPVHLHTKSIVKCKDVDNCINPHFFKLKTGCKAVSTDYNLIDGPFSQKPNWNIAWVNHYHVQSMIYYLVKNLTGTPDGAPQKPFIYNEMLRDACVLDPVTSIYANQNKIFDKTLM